MMYMTRHLVCFPVLHHRLGALHRLTNNREARKAWREVWGPSEEVIVKNYQHYILKTRLLNQAVVIGAIVFFVVVVCHT